MSNNRVECHSQKALKYDKRIEEIDKRTTGNSRDKEEEKNEILTVLQ